MNDRTLTFIVLGAILWLAGAVFIRFTGPLGWFAPSLEMILVYAATPIVMWLTLLLILRGFPVPPGRVTIAVVVMSITALLLDGVALAWAPGLYGAVGAAALGGPAAWLLWAVGCSLVAAMWIDGRRL